MRFKYHFHVIHCVICFERNMLSDSKHTAFGLSECVLQILMLVIEIRVNFLI